MNTPWPQRTIPLRKKEQTLEKRGEKLDMLKKVSNIEGFKSKKKRRIEKRKYINKISSTRIYVLPSTATSIVFPKNLRGWFRDIKATTITKPCLSTDIDLAI